MFPDLGNDVVRSALERSAGDIESASNYLLDMVAVRFSIGANDKWSLHYNSPSFVPQSLHRRIHFLFFAPCQPPVAPAPLLPESASASEAGTPAPPPWPSSIGPTPTSSAATSQRPSATDVLNEGRVSFGDATQARRRSTAKSLRLMTEFANFRLSAERRWSDRPEVRNSGLLSSLNATEIKRQEVREGKLVQNREGRWSHFGVGTHEHVNSAYSAGNGRGSAYGRSILGRHADADGFGFAATESQSDF